MLIKFALDALLVNSVTNLGHDVLVVIVAQRPTELVVIHVRFALAFAPAARNLVWVRHLNSPDVPSHVMHVALL